MPTSQWNSFSVPMGSAITKPGGHLDHGRALNVLDAPVERAVFVSNNGLPGQTSFGPSLTGLGPRDNVMPSSATQGPSSAAAPHALTAVTGNLLAMKSGVLSHLDMQLASIYQQQTAGDAAKGSTVIGMGGAGFDSAMSFAGGKQYVTIDVTVKDLNGNGSTSDDAGGALAQLQAIGLINGSSYAGMVSGRIAVDKVADLGQLLDSGDLGFARVSGIQTSAGLVESQADIAQRGDIARSTYFVQGDGVNVGVLSDSFDTGPGSMARDIASRDLPSHTFILEDIAGGSDEGRAMAQLIHDIAPGADIDFATAFGGQAGFANNILALADLGDQVIVDDVIYFFELMYQEGVIAQAVNEVAANGVAYFSSAGNNGNEGLQQAWVDGGSETIAGIEYGSVMEFAPGQNYLPITLADAEVIMLSWDEPGASAGGVGSASDVDLFLTNQDGTVVYAASAAFNEGADPMEGLGISGGTGGVYYLRVGLYSGPAPTEIKLVAMGNGAPVDLGTTAGNFNDGTGYGHKAADGAIDVGAVRYDATPAWGANPPDSESFTSSGPTRIWFDNDGNRLAAPDDRQVDISAVDGANTTFFGFDYEGDGFPNFFGTSAAAPDAAAVAALMIEARAGLNVQDIENLLKSSCLDMDANNGSPPGVPNPGVFDNGPDDETGHGLIQADLAVGFARTLRIENADQTNLYGTHFGDVIVGNGNINRIDAGAGNDIIRGGFRGDFLTGGDGMDRFVYESRFDSAGIRHDQILDLDDVQDTIDLSALDADDFAAGNQDFQIVSSFDGNAGELVLKYHTGGGSAGFTTIKGYTNGDNKVDLLIWVAGDHSGFTNFDF